VQINLMFFYHSLKIHKIVKKFSPRVHIDAA